MLLPDSGREGIYYGISCKMRRTLNVVDRVGRVTLELSNSADKFWDELKPHDLNETNYADNPARAGGILVALVESWYDVVSIYYPPINQAIWISNRFQLEPLPTTAVGYGILRKVAEYFPDLWKQVN